MADDDLNPPMIETQWDRVSLQKTIHKNRWYFTKMVQNNLYQSFERPEKRNRGHENKKIILALGPKTCSQELARPKFPNPGPKISYDI